MRHAPTYLVSAGELSGDLLGSSLVLALQKYLPNHKPFGLAGPAMQRAGVRSVVPQDVFHVMGFLEVLGSVADLREAETVFLQAIDRSKPEFAVLVDYPGFHLRLAEQLKLRGLPVIQYVAPQLWAWGEGRIPQYRRSVDLMLGILPFEADYFASKGIAYRYVGSPMYDRASRIVVDRGAFGIPANVRLFAALPGSRKHEIASMLPIIKAVRDMVCAEIPEAVFWIPLAESLGWGDVRAALPPAHVKEKLTPCPGCPFEAYEYKGLYFIRGMSLELMALAEAALVNSGTATLECALLRTPLAVAYKLNSLSFAIAKQRVRSPYISLVNIIAKEPLVKEYVQDFSAREVADELLRLVGDTTYRRRIVDGLERVHSLLEGNAARNAAGAVHSFLVERGHGH